MIVKQYASAFFGTSLASTLTALRRGHGHHHRREHQRLHPRDRGRRLQHGFVPLVVRQAVRRPDPGPHEAALFDMQAKYAEVLDEDTVKAYLAKVGSA